MCEAITNKQYEFIKCIESYGKYGVPPFTGNTKAQASAYIDKYKDVLEDYTEEDN